MKRFALFLLFFVPSIIMADGLLEGPVTGVLGKWLSPENSAMVFALIGALAWRLLEWLASEMPTKAGTFWLNVFMKILMVFFGDGVLKNTTISSNSISSVHEEEKLKEELKKKYPILR